jgi:hypothetical protein
MPSKLRAIWEKLPEILTQVTDKENIGQFVAARQFSGHPIALTGTNTFT